MIKTRVEIFYILIKAMAKRRCDKNAVTHEQSYVNSCARRQLNFPLDLLTNRHIAIEQTISLVIFVIVYKNMYLPVDMCLLLFYRCRSCVFNFIPLYRDESISFEDAHTFRDAMLSINRYLKRAYLAEIRYSNN